jgi:hypothetical protein
VANADCYRGICGLALKRGSDELCQRRCWVHTDELDVTTNEYEKSVCSVAPSTLMVVLEDGRKIGEPTKNSLVAFPEPPRKCPRLAYVHPAVLVDVE